MIAVFKQLNGDHRPQPAYVADLRVFFGYRQQSVFQLLPQIVGFLQQIFLLKHLQHFQRSHAGNRVTRIGAAQTAWSDGIHYFRAPGDARQREAARDRFRKGGKIRRNAHLLHRKQRAGTPRAALHFIGNQHDPVLVTQSA